MAKLFIYMQQNLILFLFMLMNISCAIYSYTSTNSDSPPTISVNQFKNNIAHHYIDFNYKLKNALEDKLNQQHDLILVQKDGHFIFKGIIYNYSNKVLSDGLQNIQSFYRLSININITLKNTFDSTSTSKELEVSTDYLSDINFEESRDSLENVLIELAAKKIYNKFYNNW